MAQNMVYITTIGVWVCANRCILSLKWYNSAMNRQRILVTGVNGFVGPHLVRELLGRGCAVDGVGYGPEPENSTKHEDYNYIACDLTDMEEVTQKISTAGLSAVIHLAGLEGAGVLQHLELEDRPGADQLLAQVEHRGRPHVTALAFARGLDVNAVDHGTNVALGITRRGRPASP